MQITECYNEVKFISCSDPLSTKPCNYRQKKNEKYPVGMKLIKLVLRKFSFDCLIHFYIITFQAWNYVQFWFIAMPFENIVIWSFYVVGNDCFGNAHENHYIILDLKFELVRNCWQFNAILIESSWNNGIYFYICVCVCIHVIYCLC